MEAARMRYAESSSSWIRLYATGGFWQHSTLGLRRSNRSAIPANEMNAWWRARPSKHGERTWPCLIGLLTIPIVGLCNYYSGPEISFLIFYLPSIALVGWIGGSLIGGLAALEATLAWLIADLISRHIY